MFKKKVKYFEVIPENVRVACQQFTGGLKKKRKSMKKSTEKKCKAILFYVPIVSRAGTDIEAALRKIDAFKGKNVALVVLHHTYDPETVVLDSSRAVDREKTITVDCLFHEDKGLLQCHKNAEAVKKVAEWLYEVKYQKQEQSEKKNNKNKKSKNCCDTREIKDLGCAVKGGKNELHIGNKNGRRAEETDMKIKKQLDRRKRFFKGGVAPSSE